MINEILKLLLRYVESWELIAESMREIAGSIESADHHYREKNEEITELIREIEEGTTAFNVYNCKYPHSKKEPDDSISNSHRELGER